MTTDFEIRNNLEEWALGNISLKEIRGYTDEELSSIAHVAYFLLMQGKNEKARTLFEGLIAVDPQNEYYYRALGFILYRLGFEDRSLKQFSQAIDIRPELPYAYVHRAEVYLAKNNHVEAQYDLQEALDRMDYSQQELSKKAWALLSSINDKIIKKVSKRIK